MSAACHKFVIIKSNPLCSQPQLCSRQDVKNDKVKVQVIAKKLRSRSDNLYDVCARSCIRNVHCAQVTSAKRNKLQLQFKPSLNHKVGGVNIFVALLSCHSLSHLFSLLSSSADPSCTVAVFVSCKCLVLYQNI
jgi:hypothetical protein